MKNFIKYLPTIIIFVLLELSCSTVANQNTENQVQEKQTINKNCQVKRSLVANYEVESTTKIILWGSNGYDMWTVYTEKFSGESGQINFPPVIKAGEYITYQILGFEDNNPRLSNKKNKCKILSVECEE